MILFRKQKIKNLKQRIDKYIKLKKYDKAIDNLYQLNTKYHINYNTNINILISELCNYNDDIISTIIENNTINYDNLLKLINVVSSKELVKKIFIKHYRYTYNITIYFSTYLKIQELTNIDIYKIFKELSFKLLLDFWKDMTNDDVINFFKLVYEIDDINNISLSTKKEIYSHFCNYNNVEKYILLFMSKEDVFEITKNHCKNYFNDIIISLIHIDVYTILNNFKTIHETLYLKLLSKVKIIDETDTKWFGYIMDILNCQTINVLVEVLDKTNLSVEKKQEILLLRNGKSCKI